MFLIILRIPVAIYDLTFASSIPDIVELPSFSANKAMSLSFFTLFPLLRLSPPLPFSTLTWSSSSALTFSRKPSFLLSGGVVLLSCFCSHLSLSEYVLSLLIYLKSSLAIESILCHQQAPLGFCSAKHLGLSSIPHHVDSLHLFMGKHTKAKEKGHWTS